MSKTKTKLSTGFKYVYLVSFFALLSGFFHPLITNTDFESVIIGIVILFIGLAGSILLYKFSSLEKKREIFLVGGFALMITSLFYIFQITGRF